MCQSRSVQLDTSKASVSPAGLLQDLRLLPQSEMLVGQLYEYFADCPYAFRDDRHNCWMKGTCDEIADLLEHDLIHTQEVWWESLPGVLEIADVPDDREEHEKFSDG